MGVKCPRCGKTDSVQEAPDGGYACNLCRFSFGGCDILDKSIIRSLTFNVRPVFVSPWSLCVKEKGEDACFDFRHGTERRRGDIAKESWDSFLSSLVEDVFIASWKPMYFSASEMKGAIWEISIKLRHKHLISYKGVGCFPPYWDELVSIIKELFRDTITGIDIACM